MMGDRFSWCVASVIVAFDCARKAAGLEPQSLFANDAIWLWWIAAFLWAVVAFRAIYSQD